jgi:hypothetical protein
MIKLPKSAYIYALKHLMKEGDTDLFPTAFEIQALKYNWPTIIDQLNNLDLSSYEWSGGRRFVIPTGRLSFRNATQLEPLDSLVITALIKTFGKKIEGSRVPIKERQVFSYRFEPKADGSLYGGSSSWHEFWQTSLNKAAGGGVKWVAIADITDYYNQIYHHVLANQLIQAGVPKAVTAIIEKRFLGTLTHGVSRGIPVGPHSMHLLAGCALIPIDQSLISRGYDFCRYADDFHFFCKSQEEARVALFDFADTLDKQQRLTIQKQKVRVMPAEEFINHANSMLIDRPLNEDEKEILKVIGKYSSGPYENVSLDSLSAEDLNAVASDVLTPLFELYLGSEPINYPRIGWLLRRLTQVGAPGAVDFTLEHISDLAPALGDVSRYLMRASPNYSGDMNATGQLILDALDHPLIEHSEYVMMILFSLFATIPKLNHINEVTARYQDSPPSVRREIMFAAGTARQGHWVKEQKDDFTGGDPWTRRALIYAARSLPGDEADHWLSKIKNRMSGMEKIVARWAFKNKGMKLGNVTIP